MNNNKSVQSFNRREAQPDKKNGLPQYIPVEINLSQLPFFASDTKGLRGKVTDFRDEVRLSDGSVVPLHWQVSGNTVYGYPSPFAERVFYAIIEIAFESGYPVQNPIPLKISEVCRRLGLQRFDSKKERFVIDSRDRKRVKKAIRSIKAALIVCKGAFRLNGELVDLDDDGVSLFQRTAFIGEKNAEGEKITHTAVWLSDFLLQSINAPYLRPVDRMVIERLADKAKSAPKIYNYVSCDFAKRVFAKRARAPFVDVSYQKIAVIADIALKPSLSAAKRSFELAHKALIEEGVIEKFKWVGDGTKSESYKIRYWPGPKARQEYSEGPKAIQRTYQLSLFPKKQDAPTDGEVYQKLIDLGFDRGGAKTLLSSYKISDISLHLAYLNHELGNKKSIANPPGWLRTSLSRNYSAPPNFVDPAELEARRLVKAKRLAEQAKAEKEQAAIIAAEDQKRDELLSWFRGQPNRNIIREKILQSMIEAADDFNSNILRNLEKPVEETPMYKPEFCSHLADLRK